MRTYGFFFLIIVFLAGCDSNNGVDTTGTSAASTIAPTVVWTDPYPGAVVEARHVESAVVVVDPDPFHHDAALLLEREPGRDVGIVVEPREHDFVPGAKAPPDGPGDREGQGGHVLAECDFVGIAGAQEIGRSGVSLGQDGVALLAGREGALVVGVRSLQVAGHGLDSAARHLCAAGSVEVAVRTSGVFP